MSIREIAYCLKPVAPTSDTVWYTMLFEPQLIESKAMFNFHHLDLCGCVTPIPRRGQLPVTQIRFH